MQKASRRAGPEVQNALAAKQQAQQDTSPLQEQLDVVKRALDQQRAAAQKLEQVRA